MHTNNIFLAVRGVQVETFLKIKANGEGSVNMNLKKMVMLF